MANIYTLFVTLLLLLFHSLLVFASFLGLFYFIFIFCYITVKYVSLLKRNLTWRSLYKIYQLIFTFPLLHALMLLRTFYSSFFALLRDEIYFKKLELFNLFFFSSTPTAKNYLLKYEKEKHEISLQRDLI